MQSTDPDARCPYCDGRHFSVDCPPPEPVRTAKEYAEELRKINVLRVEVGLRPLRERL